MPDADDRAVARAPERACALVHAVLVHALLSRTALLGAALQREERDYKGLHAFPPNIIQGIALQLQGITPPLSSNITREVIPLFAQYRAVRGGGAQGGAAHH